MLTLQVSRITQIINKSDNLQTSSSIIRLIHNIFKTSSTKNIVAHLLLSNGLYKWDNVQPQSWR